MASRAKKKTKPVRAEPDLPPLTRETAGLQRVIAAQGLLTIDALETLRVAEQALEPVVHAAAQRARERMGELKLELRKIIDSLDGVTGALLDREPSAETEERWFKIALATNKR